MGESIKIDIWSDIACPWCYIGKRKLEDAIGRFEALPEAAPVEIEYHSFELAPDTPVDLEGSEVDFLVGHKRRAEERRGGKECVSRGRLGGSQESEKKKKKKKKKE